MKAVVSFIFVLQFAFLSFIQGGQNEKTGIKINPHQSWNDPHKDEDAISLITETTYLFGSESEWFQLCMQHCMAEENDPDYCARLCGGNFPEGYL